MRNSRGDGRKLVHAVHPENGRRSAERIRSSMRRCAATTSFIANRSTSASPSRSTGAHRPRHQGRGQPVAHRSHSRAHPPISAHKATRSARSEGRDVLITAPAYSAHSPERRSSTSHRSRSCASARSKSGPRFSPVRKAKTSRHSDLFVSVACSTIASSMAPTPTDS